MVLRLRGKTHEYLAVFGLSELFENVLRRFQLEGEGGILFLDFLRSNRLWPEVQWCRGLDHDIGVAGVVEDGAPHLIGGAHMNRVGKLQFGWAGNEYDLCSPVPRGFRKGISHLPGGPIADISDGIDVFDCGARSDQDLSAFKITTAVEHRHDEIHDLLDRRQPARTVCSAC